MAIMVSYSFNDLFLLRLNEAQRGGNHEFFLDQRFSVLSRYQDHLGEIKSALGFSLHMLI